MAEVLVTAHGLERLTRELEELHRERDRLAERMTQALAQGGAKGENGDFLDARHDAALLERRIALLESRFAAAEVVEPVVDGEVDVGERVTVRDLSTGATTKYVIVGSGEANASEGAISHESPIGSALVGRRVGDVVEAETPSGTVRLELLAVEG
ncbi:MAG TPA: GreA/GreB family elongation factor [Gaiellaceae bacterium]|nr:GreA/GreB family elongation factor [Gaiellaceae bacterium]